MREIKVVLFDLGNTLVYFDGDWDQVLDEAIEKLSNYLSTIDSSKIPPLLFSKQYEKALEQYYIERDIDEIEKTTCTLLRTILEEQFHLFLSPSQLEAALKEFYSHTGSHWKLDEDTIPTLRYLTEQGYLLGLISNAAHTPDVYAQLEQYKLEPYFQQILVSAAVGIRKPNPLIFQKAIDYFQSPPSSFVMVGDTLSADIIGSRKAGMKNIWVARWVSAPSTHYRDDAITPDRKVSHLSEIPALIENWNEI